MRTTLPWLSLLPPLAVACDLGKPTRAECTEMLDRYLDMTASEPASLGPTEAAAAREASKAIRKGGAPYHRALAECQSTISRREQRCATKAPTPEMWQACID